MDNTIASTFLIRPFEACFRRFRPVTGAPRAPCSPIRFRRWILTIFTCIPRRTMAFIVQRVIRRELLTSTSSLARSISKSSSLAGFQRYTDGLRGILRLVCSSWTAASKGEPILKKWYQSELLNLTWIHWKGPRGLGHTWRVDIPWRHYLRRKGRSHIHRVRHEMLVSTRT